MTVYVDLVILLNFVVDLLLILGTNKLTGCPNGFISALIGAGIGALYSGLCFLPGMSFLGGALWRVAILCLVSLASFGRRPCTFQCMITFVVLSMALGGLATGIGDGSFWMIIGCCLCLYVLIRIDILKFDSSKYVTAELKYNGTVRRITALWDSGNLLKDPLSGESVMVVSSNIAKELLCITSEQLKDPICSLPTLGIKGLRLLPYRAIGQTGGMLLALRMDSVRINGRRAGSLVAFAPEEIGDGKFQALIGGTK